MKPSTDVVIVGGGCMGASVAYHLARRGCAGGGRAGRIVDIPSTTRENLVNSCYRLRGEKTSFSLV